MNSQLLPFLSLYVLSTVLGASTSLFVGLSVGRSVGGRFVKNCQNEIRTVQVFSKITIAF